MLAEALMRAPRDSRAVEAQDVIGCEVDCSSHLTMLELFAPSSTNKVANHGVRPT